MGDVNLHDKTAKKEQKLQKRLLHVANQNILSVDAYYRARTTATTNL